MNKKILFPVLAGILAAPLLASAQFYNISYGPAISITSLINGAKTTAWVVFGGVAVICFVVAGVLFLTAQGAPEKLKTAKAAVMWGIAGVIVGIVAYSIIALVEAIVT